jgi:integrase
MNAMDPLSTRQLNRAIHAAAAGAHIDKRVSMHTLRHYAELRTMPIETKQCDRKALSAVFV